jgi:hypothetical protein
MGYLIGRVVPSADREGPWWEFVKMVASRTDAIREAGKLAKAAGGRAWFHHAGDRFELIPAGPEQRSTSAQSTSSSAAASSLPPFPGRPHASWTQTPEPDRQDRTH